MNINDENKKIMREITKNVWNMESCGRDHCYCKTWRGRKILAKRMKLEFKQFNRITKKTKGDLILIIWDIFTFIILIKLQVENRVFVRYLFDHFCNVFL